MTIELADYVGNTATLDAKFQVVLYPFKTQKLTIAAEKIREEVSIGAPEKELEDKLAELVQQSPSKKLWHGLFYVPLDIRSI